MSIFYAIGDIHGRADLLLDLLERIDADAKAHGYVDPTIVYLGDYIDRGPDSRAVLDIVLEDRPGFRTVRLKGNHETMAAAFLAGEDTQAAAAFVLNDPSPFARSYGMPCASQTAFLTDIHASRRALLDRMPWRHLELLRHGLQRYHEEAGHIFVHAGVRPGKPLEEHSTATMTWIRGPFLESDADHGGIVVHGHTIEASEPVVRANRINVDIGAYRSGKLAATVVGDGEPRFIIADTPREVPPREERQPSYLLVADRRGTMEAAELELLFSERPWQAIALWREAPIPAPIAHGRKLYRLEDSALADTKRRDAILASLRKGATEARGPDKMALVDLFAGRTQALDALRDAPPSTPARTSASPGRTVSPSRPRRTPKVTITFGAQQER